MVATRTVRAGKVILATRSSLAKAPDGNGGVYMSLQQAGVLDLLEQQGAAGLLCSTTLL